MEFRLNVFTLNCWGIPIVSKNRKERFEAISKYLLESSHSIVCLQEVWSEKDYLFLRDNLKHVLPYSHYFYSGVLGSGLCVFSKWVIKDVFFHQWPLNGYIHKVHHGDWFGGKGVGLCRIKCGERLVNIYCTHLHAEYHVDDIYLAHRVLQAYSTAEFVNLTTYPADISILAGDLNTAPGDLSFKILTQLPSLVDPYDMKCEDTPGKLKASGTCDNANNSYSDQKLASKLPEGKRIDHILFHVNSSWEAHVLNFGNPLEERVPGQTFSYSDHNAVALELLIKPSEHRINQRQDSKGDCFDETITQAIKVCEEATVNISKSKKLFLTAGTLIFLFLLATVGFWPNFIVYDVIKLIITGLCFYYLIMGSLWNKIELNSLKAGLSALENYSRTRMELKSLDEEIDAGADLVRKRPIHKH
ncbi:putative neutral sphingomyelinase [Manduca sexta]|uniref:putative neutral sphingomyelinase n=1 Tax=Manduca sexta TaxID=7130 RepID=UPI001183F96E|nr:putative neutral sphingomyelinase [Manduca sexta]XP_037297239.1 putative neutral sphingomyelinase [Manduca sexta]XP_037297240.1 putative neutral sphingomyelinase [Manduca sexta]XP_037297242.1 putative neutral sphingomyelinase [Manduca sexta]